MGKKIQRIGRYSLDGVTLGWGNFAKVDLATHELTRVKVAVKIIDTKKIKDEYVRANLHREARIMASLRHPHIVRLYETLKATTLYCLVTEYVTGGDLLEYIKSRENHRLDESSSRLFIRQLVSAVAYLHERGVVHRDLKMENILLDEKKRNVKLIDFGLSNIFRKRSMLLRTHCGSPEYAAPELFIVGKTYGPEIDIWSLGIITYAMTLGRLPFCTTSNDEYQRHKLLQQIQKGLSAVHEKEMQILSSSCRNLLYQLIEPQPQLRIPLSEIQVHPWITKNGRHPFFLFTGFPKTNLLRNQVIGELSYLSEIKKGILNELVNENKSDEISAMFNMMMDKKKQDLGFYDIDYTKKLCQSKSTDKTSTPESCRTTSTLSRKIKTKKVISKTEYTSKKSHESSHANKQKHKKSQSASTHCQTCLVDDKDAQTSFKTPSETCDLIFMSYPYFKPPTSSISPPLKLSMTLDLSVASLSSTVDQLYRPAQIGFFPYDSVHGVAASSGVPPRMSPKEEAKPLPRKVKCSTFCSISLRKKLVFPCSVGSRDAGSNSRQNKSDISVTSSSKNICRPSTLLLKIRTKKPRFSSRASTATSKGICFGKIVAPTASPECSFVDDTSSNETSDDSDADEAKNSKEKTFSVAKDFLAGKVKETDLTKSFSQSNKFLQKNVNFKNKSHLKSRKFLLRTFFENILSRKNQRDSKNAGHPTSTERLSLSLDCLLPIDPNSKIKEAKEIKSSTDFINFREKTDFVKNIPIKKNVSFYLSSENTFLTDQNQVVPSNAIENKNFLRVESLRSLSFSSLPANDMNTLDHQISSNCTVDHNEIERLHALL